MSEDISAKPSPPAPLGFATTFAWLVLVSLVTFVFICDALPAIGAKLPVNTELGTGPMASLYHLVSDYFWPGAILLHAGLATLWLACGPWRYSLRLLFVILSMSARAAWVWQLYGIREPDPTHFGEPFNVCGIPIFMALVIVITSLGFLGFRLENGRPSHSRERLQIVDLLAWTTAFALLLMPAMTFFRALTPSVLIDRILYDTTIAMAWAGLTWFSAMLIREWLIEAPFSSRLPRLGWTLLAITVTCGVLIASARLVSRIGPQDMTFNILSYFLPSMLLWCMAMGWTLRELGIRLVPRSINRV
jgi:hypothetical protein